MLTIEILGTKANFVMTIWNAFTESEVKNLFEENPKLIYTSADVNSKVIYSTTGSILLIVVVIYMVLMNLVGCGTKLADKYTNAC